MSGEYSTISSFPGSKFIQTSQPYCLFRDRERHILDHAQCNAYADGDVSRVADNQTLMYLNELSNHHVPSHMMYGALRREIVMSAGTKIASKRRQMIATFHCNDKPKFLHVGGKSMDELIIRDVRHSFRAVNLRDPPGFTLPLGGGASLHQVAVCGQTQWATKSNILARTLSEVYHVRTLDVDDVLSGVETSRARSSVILEPVQKWQLPEDIASMSISPAGWSTANLITTNGSVYTWSPTDGVMAVNNSTPIAFSKNERARSFDLSIECTLHPQVSLTTSHKSVLSFDLRCPQHAPAVYTAANSVKCVKQHGGVAHHFLLSDGDFVRLIDTRFPRMPVAQQYIPGGHNVLKFVKTPDGHASGVFIGSSAGAAQLYMHSLDSSKSSKGPEDSSIGRNQHLLHAAAGYGCQDATLWDVDAFPLVDDSAAQGSSNGGANSLGEVWGFDLAACGTSTPAGPLSDDEAGDTESESKQESSSVSNDDSTHSPYSNAGVNSAPRRVKRTRRDLQQLSGVPKYSALLLQQSAKGDVFAQRVVWTVNPYLSTGGRCRTGSIDLSQSPGRASSSVQMVGRKRPNSYSQLGRNDDSDDESSTSRGNFAYRTHRKASLAAITSVTSGPARRRKNVFSQRGDGSDEDSDASSDSHEGTPKRPAPTPVRAATLGTRDTLSLQRSANEADSMPPVQTGLACGVRCFTAPSVLSDGVAETGGEAKGHASNAVKESKHYLKTVIRNNGLVLQNAVSWTDISALHSGIHPSGSGAFQPFVPEDTQRGFDLIKMFPEDLRLDLPPLPSHKALLMKQAPPIVEGKQLVETHVSRISKELISYVEKEPKTLWELWKRALLTSDKRMDVNTFRATLVGQLGLLESVIPLSGEAAGLHQSLNAGHSSADNSPHNSRDDESQQDIHPHMVGSATAVCTFDGLLVQTAEKGAQSADVYRDQSKGYEVRMSRPSRNPSLPRINGVVEDEASAEERCSCVTNMSAILGGRAALCGERSCLMPHRLVYRLPAETAERVGPGSGSAAQKAPQGRRNNKAKAAEPFQWGSSLLPPTAPSQSMASAAPARVTQSQSMSLSQALAQSQSQPRSPAPASSQQRAAQSTGMRSQEPSQTPAVRTVEGQIDVTDNILAVLNNNWNRTLNQTAHQDPAKTSLLMSIKST